MTLRKRLLPPKRPLVIPIQYQLDKIKTENLVQFSPKKQLTSRLFLLTKAGNSISIPAPYLPSAVTQSLSSVSPVVHQNASSEDNSTTVVLAL